MSASRKERASARAKKRGALVDSGLLAMRAAKEAQRRRERECFWTWPWGHDWLNDVCVNCGAEEPPI